MSVAVHACLGYAMMLPWGPVSLSAPEPIPIEYVRYEKTAPVSPPAPAPVVRSGVPESSKPAAPAGKKVKGIPVPRVEATDFQKIVDEQIKRQVSQLKRLDAPVYQTRISSSMTSAELIADPVKGSIFVGYFGQVKKKIQNTVFQKAGRDLYGRGSVCLGFVLGAGGQLENLTVLSKGTDADESMKALAAQCIRDSAPFGSFPKDLGPRHIYFNITIFFDGTA